VFLNPGRCSFERIKLQFKAIFRRSGDLLESLIQPSQSPEATWETFGFPASLAASQGKSTQKATCFNL
jgi:hypothetical protein